MEKKYYIELLFDTWILRNIYIEKTAEWTEPF